MAGLPRYASIMVHLDLGTGADDRLALARDLAGRLGAHLIGAASAEPWMPATGDPAMGMDATMIETYRQMVEDDLGAVESAFRRIAGPDAEWRRGSLPPGRFLVDQARAADLVVIGRDSGPATRWHLAAAPGDVVLGLGRPLLVVPPGVRRLAADRIVVGWKNTAPSRRAIADALPLLRRAGKVLVVAVGDACEEGPEDVVALLRRHEVAAAAMLRPAVAAPPADELMRIAAGESADLIVTGAYGHARMREWILGGVTRALLDDAPICCLMSH